MSSARIDLPITVTTVCSCCAATSDEPTTVDASAASPVTAQVLVAGMTCAHCVRAVTDELSLLPGVTGVDVDLTPDGLSPVTIHAAGRLDPTAVRDAIREAGYALAGETA